MSGRNWPPCPVVVNYREIFGSALAAAVVAAVAVMFTADTIAAAALAEQLKCRL